MAHRATWEEHCRRHVLAVPLDGDGRPFWRPSARAVSWQEVDGAGTVYATTTARPRGAEPHDLSLIDLDCGVRMMGAVRGGGRIGMRVRLVWRDADDVPVPEWAPAP